MFSLIPSVQGIPESCGTGNGRSMMRILRTCWSATVRNFEHASGKTSRNQSALNSGFPFTGRGKRICWPNGLRLDPSGGPWRLRKQSANGHWTQSPQPTRRLVAPQNSEFPDSPIPPIPRTKGTSMNTEQLIRNLRRHPLLWSDGPKAEQVSRILRKALARQAHDRRQTESRGVYSGLTRAELQRSRTCETDWY